MPSTRVVVLLTGALGALVLAGCGSGSPGAAPAGTDSSTRASSAGSASEGTLLIYSGRNEQLVGPILDQLEAQVGVPVQVRYGDSAAMSAQLLEEGDATQADLFFSQDAGALGALAKAGRLQTLPAAQTSAVLDGYADGQRRWVATSARARVIAYHPQRAPKIATSTTITDVLDPQYRGKVGFAPTNASFHSFVTALRVALGEDGARDWLTKFKDNEPRAYDKNTAVLEGVEAGEVDLGLINHYYWYERVAEKGADQVVSKVRFLDSTDPGALINVAGVGVVEGSDQAEAALKAVAFLLSKPAQTYFADEAAEYPVIAGVSTSRHKLPELSTLSRPGLDLNDLDSLPQTLSLLNEVGLT